ncbi:hypothetical protein M3Y97_01050900 [Aphelenchoides bicaudatus]|nr:hypothetical protein M3Y97_01050900 [Aphelenchoides bicaudatus]
MTLFNFTRHFQIQYVNDGGRYGNLLFRVGSMYGIGKTLDRIACLEYAFTVSFRSEFKKVFPNLHNYVLLEDCWTDKSKIAEFENKIWNYVNVSKLDKYADFKHLRLYTGVLECPAFFFNVRHEICKMFEFSASFNQEIDELAKQVFGDDKSPKICAHIRRSDFFNGGHPLLPSYEPFTSKALDYLATTVSKEKKVDKVSFLLLNDDIDFTNNAAKQVKKNSHVKNIFTTKNFKPIEDMGVAIRHCDYFLLTSSGSTFGWWIAYLMPDSKQQNTNHVPLFKTFSEIEFFPPEWNRLVHDVKSDAVFVQNRSIPGIHI